MLSLFRAKTFSDSMQLALWVAMLSVIFQRWEDLLFPTYDLQALFSAWAMVMGTILFLVPKLRQLAIWIFIISLLVSFFGDWYSAANHTWLAVWTLAPVILFSRWWNETTYSLYLRLTLGLVLIIAGLQKIAAGTYLDGSYIAWMSHYGSATERSFQFLCSGSGSEVCGWFVTLGVAAIVWQIAAGLLVLFGLKHLIFILIEFGFLLFVGYFADEMNFQVLNIALLCIAFRFGMPLWVAISCIGLLILDLIGISEIIVAVLL